MYGIISTYTSSSAVEANLNFDIRWISSSDWRAYNMAILHEPLDVALDFVVKLTNLGVEVSARLSGSENLFLTAVSSCTEKVKVNQVSENKLDLQIKRR